MSSNGTDNEGEKNESTAVIGDDSKSTTGSLSKPIFHAILTTIILIIGVSFILIGLGGEDAILAYILGVIAIISSMSIYYYHIQ